jgi:hypothetical protein
MDILYSRVLATAREVMDEIPGNPADSTVRTQLRVLERKGQRVIKVVGGVYISRQSCRATKHNTMRCPSSSVARLILLQPRGAGKAGRRQRLQPSAAPATINRHGFHERERSQQARAFCALPFGRIEFVDDPRLEPRCGKSGF